MVPAAQEHTKACSALQRLCALPTDWRFRFGAVGLLVGVMKGTQDAAVLELAFRGVCVKGEGFCG